MNGLHSHELPLQHCKQLHDLLKFLGMYIFGCCGYSVIDLMLWMVERVLEIPPTSDRPVAICCPQLLHFSAQAEQHCILCAPLGP